MLSELPKRKFAQALTSLHNIELRARTGSWDENDYSNEHDSALANRDYDTT